MQSSYKNVEPDPNSVNKVRITSARKYIGHFIWPIESGRFSSGFGRRWFSFHEGIDIAAPEGTPILAAHDGQVVYADDKIRGYGNLVILQAPGILTIYAHARRFNVHVGEKVLKGDVISYVGATGEATGPHLHFETRVKDQDGTNVAIDPLTFYNGETH